MFKYMAWPQQSQSIAHTHGSTLLHRATGSV